MKKTALLIALLFVSVSLADEKDKDIPEAIKISLHSIEIGEWYVKEEIVVENTGKKDYDGNISIWLNAPKADVWIGSKVKEYNVIDNIISVNLKDYGVNISSKHNRSIVVHYELKDKFEKKIIYSTDKMELTVKTSRYVRGSIPLEYKNNAYHASFKPEIGDIITIEIQREEKESNLFSLIVGLIAIFLGAVIVFLAARRR